MPTPSPALRDPPSLPITGRRDEIVAAIRAHQVVVVAGETGSGKSTQLPKLCLEAGRGRTGLIGHTQPRRLAARTIAARIAEELGTTVGEAVGCTVRFSDQVGPNTRIKLMTDGILLAELQRDRRLHRYDTIIVDEAHERSLNIDFVLGYLRDLLPRRPDLKVIVTSATIDTEKFAAHFGGAPVIEVSGRSHPVEVRYRPVGGDEDDRDQIQAIADAVDELRGEGPGDILVFLSGEREIRDTAAALAELTGAGTEILPLYARLSHAEQQRVFRPHTGRRIVLATNVAETSLTVPGIRFVVDPGTARISRYNRRTKVQRLPIEPISQASANQRAGRCGRVAPGVCIRLYSEEDFASRPAFTEPEILRTNLASVILQMAALGLGDVTRFPFVDPPETRNIRDGLALLEELGALAPSKPGGPVRLTPLGTRLARFPLDPRLARMIVEAERNGCVREVMVIAAALSIQDPRERPQGKRDEADEAHARFAVDGSDFLAFLSLWDHVREQQRGRSSNQFRKLCRSSFLNYLRVREWQDVYAQLQQVARQSGIRPNPDPASPDAIHRSLLAGLLSHIGRRDSPAREYVGARNARFAIAPGSVLFRNGPRWVMAAELVETNRLWGRVAARIRPEWVEPLAAHLVARSYSEPHWDPSRGAAMAFERVTLYGIPIVERRRVPYARVDPGAARQLFLRHALVEGDWRSHHAFARRNDALVARVRALEDRARRRDLLAGEDARVAFFDARVPDHVVSARHFDRWWNGARQTDPHLLDYTFDVLAGPAAAAVAAEDFPDTWPTADGELPLRYRYAPGDEADGVTVHLTLPQLTTLDPAPFEWHVPGHREALVSELIRHLPKDLRRRLTPARDHARAFVAAAGPADGPLPAVLARFLSRAAGTPVSPGHLRFDALAPHLRLRFAVHDAEGRELAAGRDVDALHAALAPDIDAAVARAARRFERHGIRAWDFGTIERSVQVPWAGLHVEAYPALVDEGDAVGLALLATEAEQRRAMWAGTRRLLRLTVPSPAKALRHVLGPETTRALAAYEHGSAAELVEDCRMAAIDALLARHGGPAWDAAGFDALRAAVGAELLDVLARAVRASASVVAAAARVRRRAAALRAPALAPTVDDVLAQVDRLVPPGFAARTGAARLADLVRYLRAAERRLEKLPEAPGRDRSLLQRVQALEAEHAALAAHAPPGAAGDLRRVRWLLEELRVSFFAQSLGTAEPVSEKRIAAELARIAALAPSSARG